MNKKCKNCGNLFETDSKWRVLCESCADEYRKKSTIAERVCRSCGLSFLGGPRAFYCPECRAQRKKQQTKDYLKRKALGNNRALGSTDICTVCGGKYVVESGTQRYCPLCAKEAIANADREQSRAYAAEHKEEFSARKVENSSLMPQITCIVCGKAFCPNGAEQVCSPACAEIRRKKWMKAGESNRQPRRK